MGQKKKTQRVLFLLEKPEVKREVATTGYRCKDKIKMVAKQIE
jgi:hypothetical protein